MKTIIAGSRTIKDMRHVLKAINKCGWEITEVVCGCAEGVDTLGRQWAQEAGIPVKEFPADWDNIDVPGAVVKTTKYGKRYNGFIRTKCPASCPVVQTTKYGKRYNAAAGPARNQRMADYSEALILIHNGSRGSRDMLKRAKDKGLKIWEVIV
jgi:hypothetical protein